MMDTCDDGHEQVCFVATGCPACEVGTDMQYDLDSAQERIDELEGLLQFSDSDAKTAKYVNEGICARFKFSNQRTDLILGKNKKEKDDTTRTGGQYTEAG